MRQSKFGVSPIVSHGFHDFPQQIQVLGRVRIELAPTKMAERLLTLCVSHKLLGALLH